MPSEITIGLAVFNGEKTIAAALDSIIAQKLTSWTLLISDNCSTDDTEAVCVRYAAMDARIRYSRRAKNLGIADNYRHLLVTADTPYFMWAAADDLWAPGFLLAHHEFLEAHPDYVLSQSQVLFWSNRIPSRMALGTYPLRGTPKANGSRFFARPADNSRFYGLIRTKPLQKVYPSEIFYGFDWLVSGGTLKFGKHNEFAQILMVRDETPAADYQAGVARYAHSPLFRLFPILPLAIHVLKRQTVPVSAALIWSLLRTNVRISIRFATFRLYSTTSSAPDSTRYPGWPMQGVKRQLSKLLAPGMSERLVTRTQNIGRAFRTLATNVLSVASKRAGNAVGSSQNVQNFVPRKTSGWRAPRAPSAARPWMSVLVAADNQLGNLLSILDGLQDVAADIAFEVIVLDNASLDATSLVLKNRPDVRLIARNSPLPVGLLLNEMAQAAQGERLVFLDPTVLLSSNSILALVKSLDHAELTLLRTVKEDAVESLNASQVSAFGIARRNWTASGGNGAGMSAFSEAGASLEEQIGKTVGRVLVQGPVLISLPNPALPDQGAAT